MTATSQQAEFTTIAKGEVIIARDCVLEAEVNDWPAQPGFPASVDLCLSVSGTILQFSPEQVIAVAPKFTEFTALLVELANQGIAHRDGDPVKVKLPRTWTLTAPASYGHVKITETCLSFCRADHTSDRNVHPMDLWHQQYGPSMTLAVTDTAEPPEPDKVLAVSIDQRPHDLDPAARVPHARVEVSGGVWSEAMTPDAFAAFIDQLAGHVEKLREFHTVLAQAVAEHHGGGAA